MSVRSFHSVFMATAVAGAALGCYLVSLRVASERAALQDVERQIVATQSDIRLLQTEIGTRARLSQLERWNVRALALSAPTAGQILADKFQLAKLVAPKRTLDIEAPVVLAAAPAPQPKAPLEVDSDSELAPIGGLLHEASYSVAETKVAATSKKSSSRPALATEPSGKSAEKGSSRPPQTIAKKPVRTASVDPLAPLPAGHSTAEASRTHR